MDDSNDPDPTAEAFGHGGVGLPESMLEDDEMFEALAHERRRYLLYTLFEDEGWSLRDLATRLAAWENDVPVSEIEEREIERVYASLYHAHVPKLADLGIVEFDRTEETITKGPTAEQPLSVLENTGTSTADELERHARQRHD